MAGKRDEGKEKSVRRNEIRVCFPIWVLTMHAISFWGLFYKAVPNWSLHNAQWQNYWWVKNPTGFRRKQWWPSGDNIPEYTERNWGKQRKPQAVKPITWKKILTSPSYPCVFKIDSFKFDAHQNVVSDYLKLLQVLLFQCNISPLYKHSF